MVKTIILVGIGGGIGSILRFLSGLLVNKYIPLVFPWGTFMVNVVGCFLIGAFLGIFDRDQWTDPDLKTLLVIGFCGGFTTFSTFSFESLGLLQSNNTAIAIAYMALSVIICLLATWVGFFVMK